MNYDLPTAVEVSGVTYEIRSDYRAILDIMEALSDAELNDQERSFVVLDIFYPAFSEMPQGAYQEAIEKLFWFINGGEDKAQKKKSAKLMDWCQDFPRIVAPINRVIGQDVRSMKYLHWWSFQAAYMEIGDCLFAQIVGIRSKKAKGKKLDKAEQEFYKNNRHLIDLKTTYTEAENEIINQWTAKAPM